jgi:ribonuclease Z
MDLSVFFAGTAGSVPTARRGLPAVVIRAGGTRILIDCGEGTQQQLLRSTGLTDLDAIFLTHYHLDHWLGLIGMLKTFDLRDRDHRLAIYGPPGLTGLFTTLKSVIGKLGYPLDLIELDPHDEVEFGDFAMTAFAVDHRVTAYGYAWTEPDRPGRFDAAKAAALGVAPGPDFGRLQAGETVGGVDPAQVVGEARRGRKLVFSGDTAPCQAVEVFAHEADLLVHEATFMEDERDRARQTGHSTARQAAELAAAAHVRTLVLTHLSTRYFPREVRREARQAYPGAIVARDFDEIVVPFPERGDPELISATSSEPAP